MKWHDWIFLAVVAVNLAHLFGFRLPRLPRLHAPYWLQRRGADRVRGACANFEDCDVSIYFLSPAEAMYCCKTHGLICLHTDPSFISALVKEFGDHGCAYGSGQ